MKKEGGNVLCTGGACSARRQTRHLLTAKSTSPRYRCLVVQTKTETLYQRPVTFWNSCPTLHLPATNPRSRVCCAPADLIARGCYCLGGVFRCGEIRSRIRRSRM